MNNRNVHTYQESRNLKLSVGKNDTHVITGIKANQTYYRCDTFEVIDMHAEARAKRLRFKQCYSEMGDPYSLVLLEANPNHFVQINVREGSYDGPA